MYLAVLWDWRLKCLSVFGSFVGLALKVFESVFGSFVGLALKVFECV